MVVEGYQKSRLRARNVADAPKGGEDRLRGEAGRTVEERIADHHRDGIDAEIRFPNKGLAMWATHDAEFGAAPPFQLQPPAVRPDVGCDSGLQSPDHLSHCDRHGSARGAAGRRRRNQLRNARLPKRDRARVQPLRVGSVPALSEASIRPLMRWAFRLEGVHI